MKIITLTKINKITYIFLKNLYKHLSYIIKYSTNEKLKVQYCIKLVILLIFKKNFYDVAISHKFDNVW